MGDITYEKRIAMGKLWKYIFFFPFNSFQVWKFFSYSTRAFIHRPRLFFFFSFSRFPLPSPSCLPESRRTGFLGWASQRGAKPSRCLCVALVIVPRCPKDKRRPLVGWYLELYTIIWPFKECILDRCVCIFVFKKMCIILPCSF